MRRYVYGPGLDDPIAMLDEAGAVTYFHGDGRGTIIALSSGSTGSIIDKFTHGPFGELDANTGGSAYKYTARRIDEETGLYYYRNRYYHPEIGRFMSADPIGYGDGLNMYAYVGNDPVNNVDPWGLAGTLQTCEGTTECDDTTPGGITVIGHKIRTSFAKRSFKSIGGLTSFPSVGGPDIVTGPGPGQTSKPSDKKESDDDTIEEIVVVGRRLNTASVRNFTSGESFLFNFGLNDTNNCLVHGFCPGETLIELAFDAAGLALIGAETRGLKAAIAVKEGAKHFLGPAGPVFGVRALRPGLGPGKLNGFGRLGSSIRLGWSRSGGDFVFSLRIGSGPGTSHFNLPLVRLPARDFFR